MLKSPFCAHPKTGYICVPVDPKRIDEFDPMTVPRLGELVEQLSKVSNAEGASTQHLLAYKQTSLRPYIEYFEEFVQRVAGSATESGQASNGESSADSVRLQNSQAAAVAV